MPKFIENEETPFTLDGTLGEIDYREKYNSKNIENDYPDINEFYD